MTAASVMDARQQQYQLGSMTQVCRVSEEQFPSLKVENVTMWNSLWKASNNRVDIIITPTWNPGNDFHRRRPERYHQYDEFDTNPTSTTPEDENSSDPGQGQIQEETEDHFPVDANATADATTACLVPINKGYVYLCKLQTLNIISP